MTKLNEFLDACHTKERSKPELCDTCGGGGEICSFSSGPDGPIENYQTCYACDGQGYYDPEGEDREIVYGCKGCGVTSQEIYQDTGASGAYLWCPHCGQEPYEEVPWFADERKY